MSDGLVQVAPDSTGKKIDTTELTVGANTVERQRVIIGGSTASGLVDTLSSSPAGTEIALPTREVGQTQGSATSSQTGPLVQGAVTVDCPAYTTGQTDPLSLNTSGGLRVATSKIDIIQSNATIATSGSATVANIDQKEISLIINIKANPTGTTPTITFSLQDLDPVDLSTTFGSSISGAPLNSITTQIVTALNRTGAVKVSWTVTGSTPSFTQVDVTLVSKPAETVTSQTTALSNVAGSASSVTILSANTDRKGASVYNDSTVNLYMSLSSSSSSTSAFTVKLAPQQYYEVPFGYLGQMTGIWDSATGNARVTEYT